MDCDQQVLRSGRADNALANRWAINTGAHTLRVHAPTVFGFSRRRSMTDSWVALHASLLAAKSKFQRVMTAPRSSPLDRRIGEMGFMSADIGVLFAESPGLFAGAASENTAPLAEATAGMYAALKQAARRKSGSDLEDVAAVCDMCETAISEFLSKITLAQSP
jgi:hypothetical protein|tara:strand:- start:60 stop:548 length:489 start_codon:yes stop_codon:yes gene_type:complete